MTGDALAGLKNTVICGDQLDVLPEFPRDCIDLTVTSCPYGDLRDYDGYSFKPRKLIKELYRVTKVGGVVVWVVNDQTKDGTESLASCYQKIWFRASGFRIHDTMIYERQPQYGSHVRYHQHFEYMFVFSKGKPKTFNPIKDKVNKYNKAGGGTGRDKDGKTYKVRKAGMRLNNWGMRKNIWYYKVGKGNVTKDDFAYAHPAMFPEKLARDHIRSWSNPGDLVLDPMCGSGTTLKMAYLLRRKYIGIDVSENFCKLSRRRVGSVEGRSLDNFFSDTQTRLPI